MKSNFLLIIWNTWSNLIWQSNNITEIETKLTEHSNAVFTEATAFADQVVDTLNEAPTIFCKKTNTHRTLIAGDIGILCRTNKSCLLFAEELAKYGVKASISRGGLKDCREIRLVLACLFYLLLEQRF